MIMSSVFRSHTQVYERAMSRARFSFERAEFERCCVCKHRSRKSQPSCRCQNQAITHVRRYVRPHLRLRLGGLLGRLGGLLPLDRLHLIGNLGGDLAVANQASLDLLHRLLLLGRVLDLDKAETLGSAERSATGLAATHAVDDLCRLDGDGEVGEDRGEGVVVDIEREVGNEDGVLDPTVSV